MIFCYKFGTFAEFWNFCLAKYGGRLIHGYSKTCIFGAKKQGVDLYTDSTYTPENTVFFFLAFPCVMGMSDTPFTNRLSYCTSGFPSHGGQPKFRDDVQYISVLNIII